MYVCGAAKLLPTRGRLLAQQQLDSTEDANAFVSSLIADKSRRALTLEAESLLIGAPAMKACFGHEPVGFLGRALALNARVALISADLPVEESVVPDAEVWLDKMVFPTA